MKDVATTQDDVKKKDKEKKEKDLSTLMERKKDGTASPPADKFDIHFQVFMALK